MLWTDDVMINFNNIGAVRIDINADITIYFRSVLTCVYTSQRYIDIALM